jgi:endonuclease YncB( thermonuclease family)
MLLSPGGAADYLCKVTAVADGDTFTMESGKVRIRTCGIDAPERGHPATGKPPACYRT